MSDIKLYDYQNTAVSRIVHYWRKGKKRAILVSPTSSGKTVMAAELIKKFVNSGAKVLFLVHLEDLIESTYKALNGLGVKGLTKINAQTKRIENAMVYVSMVQTFKSRLQNDKVKATYENLLKDITFIIYDEVHLNFFNGFLINNELKNKFMLGMSATPKRAGKKSLQLGEKFDFKVDTISEIDLIKMGKTVPPLIVTTDADIDLSHVRTSKISGEVDYNTNDLFKAVDKRVIYDNAIENYNKYAQGLQTLAFCTNIEHTIKTCIEFNNNGIKAKFITSEPAKPNPQSKDFLLKDKRYKFYKDNYLLYSGDKDKILTQWNNKEFDILCNAGIFTTGYDNPKIRAIILIRATLSENLFLQMCGRGKRIDPETDKKEYVLIDCASNIETFQSPTAPRNYSLFHKTKQGNGDAPTKICPKCLNKVAASARICGKYDDFRQKVCYHIFETKKSILSGEFQSIRLLDIIEMNALQIESLLPEADILDFDKIADIKKYRENWKYYKIFDYFGKEGLLEYAVRKNMQPEKFIENLKIKTNIKV